MILFILAIITLMVVVLFSLEMAWGSLKMQSLAKIAADVKPPAPLVSIIFAALNEEESIGPALDSLVRLDYDNLEIIAVNDRSTDSTGKVLDDYARRYEHIQPIHISTLPPDWLGKHNALQIGAQKARGDFLLFTDADVKLETSTLKRAIRRMQDKDLDHLTLLFAAELSGSLLNMVVIEFGVTLAGFLKPWKAADPAHSRAIGIGAFNLVRTKAYEKIGGHTQIAMAPIDDVMLGVLLKKHGFRQECLYGAHFVRVPWYNSLAAMSKGLEKNSFAALDYSLLKVVAASLFMIAVSIWPYWALVCTEASTRLLNGAIIVNNFLLYGGAAHYAGIPKRHLVWLPVASYIRLYILWRAVLVNLRQGGIRWRGTFYPLSKLKAHHIPLQGEGYGKRSDKKQSASG